MCGRFTSSGFSAPSSGTGPGGNGAGTFAGVAARIPYLKELGITAVWLAGYCRANAHFFGIWSVYATERPDVLDEALGLLDLGLIASVGGFVVVVVVVACVGG